MQVSIFVDPESHHLFALTVRQTTLPSEESILFDSRSILSAFYPTTCTPLMGSYMQNMYNHVIHSFFKTTLHLFDRPIPFPMIWMILSFISTADFISVWNIGTNCCIIFQLSERSRVLKMSMPCSTTEMGFVRGWYTAILTISEDD